MSCIIRKKGNGPISADGSDKLKKKTTTFQIGRDITPILLGHAGVCLGRTLSSRRFRAVRCRRDDDEDDNNNNNNMQNAPPAGRSSSRDSNKLARRRGRDAGPSFRCGARVRRRYYPPSRRRTLTACGIILTNFIINYYHNNIVVKRVPVTAATTAAYGNAPINITFLNS